MTRNAAAGRTRSARLAASLAGALLTACLSNHPTSPPAPDSARAAAFLDTLEERTFHYFWDQESRQQLEFGKHDLAIKLALHALPRRLDRPDRPWVQAAESALYAAVAQQSFRLMLGG